MRSPTLSDTRTTVKATRTNQLMLFSTLSACRKNSTSSSHHEPRPRRGFFGPASHAAHLSSPRPSVVDAPQTSPARERYENRNPRITSAICATPSGPNSLHQTRFAIPTNPASLVDAMCSRDRSLRRPGKGERFLPTIGRASSVQTPTSPPETSKILLANPRLENLVTTRESTTYIFLIANRLQFFNPLFTAPVASL